MLLVDGVKCWAEIHEQHTRRCCSRCGGGRGPDGGLRKQRPLSGICVFYVFIIVCIVFFYCFGALVAVLKQDGATA